MNVSPRTSSDKDYYVICYDIINNRRRTRLMKLLKGYGLHVQKSVFDCFLNENQLATLKKRIDKEIERKEDSVRIYRIRAARFNDVYIMGCGQRAENPAIIVV